MKHERIAASLFVDRVAEQSFAAEFATEFEEVLATPGLCLEVRPAQSDYFARVFRPRSASVRLEIARNTYQFVKQDLLSTSSRRWAHLERLGWQRRADRDRGTRDARLATQIPSSDTALVAPFVCRTLVALLGEPMASCEIYTEDYQARRRGPAAFPHAFTLWDWRDDPPLGEIEDAVNRLLSVGEHAIRFTWPDTQSDVFALAIAGRRMTQRQADDLWIRCLRESGDRGMEAVFFNC